MNERIKQLAKQAHEDVIKNTPSFLVTKELYEQKFAELIVRECTDIIENLSPGYRDYRNQIEDAFRVASIVEIKQKFGVEE